MPKHRIAQLPDHFFGVRYPIAIAERSWNSVSSWQISKLSLPEWIMLWQVSVWSECHISAILTVGLSLGNQLPTSDTEYFALEPLLPGVVDRVNNRTQLSFSWSGTSPVIPMRQIIHTGGKRLVARYTNSSNAARQLWAMIVISAVPTDIPDDFIPANQNQADKTNELLLERTLQW